MILPFMFCCGNWGHTVFWNKKPMNLLLWYYTLFAIWIFAWSVKKIKGVLLHFTHSYSRDSACWDFGVTTIIFCSTLLWWFVIFSKKERISGVTPMWNYSQKCNVSFLGLPQMGLPIKCTVKSIQFYIRQYPVAHGYSIPHSFC